MLRSQFDQEGTNTGFLPHRVLQAGVYEYYLEMISGTLFSWRITTEGLPRGGRCHKHADYSKFDVQIGYLKAGDKKKSAPLSLTLLALRS